MEVLGLFFLIALFALVAYLRSPSVIGAAGEARVSRRLQSRFDPEEFLVLDDLMLPDGLGTTQIDHVVLARSGVFVIETKNMKGWIFGGEGQSRWTQTLRRYKGQFQNPLRQNHRHVKVIQSLLGLNGQQVFNVVVFTDRAEPKTEMPANVLWSVSDLERFLKAERPLQFDKERLVEFATLLRRKSLPADRAARVAHISALKERHAVTATTCPKCGAEMVTRTNKASGDRFLGCSKFPRCRGTRQL